jgi:hypothetical protein
MSMDQLLNMPEEQVEDGIEDLNDHLISLYSTTQEDESDDEGVQVLPKVQPQQVLNLLQTLKLGELQSDGFNASFISWFERYEQVVRKRHLRSLLRTDIESFFITNAGQVTSEAGSVAPRDTWL